MPLNACKIIGNLAEIAHDFNACRGLPVSFAPLYPPLLAQGDLARVRFTLELLTPCWLGPFALLGLRQGLLRCAREFFGGEMDAFFNPPVSCDPSAVRRFQKPAPALVLRPRTPGPFDGMEGDTLELEGLFLGVGLQHMAMFLDILREFGRCGIAAGDGRFEVTAAACQTAAGHWRPLAIGAREKLTTPDIIALGSWLDEQLPLSSPFTLKFVTPARLVAAGRTLRRPRFAQLFPFMLRRVTSMLYYHCNLEPVDDPLPLLAAAGEVEAAWQACRWDDWRELGEGGEGGKIGGISGELQLAADGFDEISWVIALATLFGIGRGAAFGAGQMQLSPCGPA